MKRMKKSIFQTVTVALATVCAVHFAFPVSTYAQSLTQVKAANSEGLTVSSSAISVVKGNTQSIKLKYNGQTLDSSRATWSSSSTSIASVSSSGVVTGKGTGTAIITVRYSGETAKVRVTVSAPDELKASIKKATLKKGKEQTVELTFNGKPLQASKATWTTSYPAVATVKSGVITAKGNGAAIITAKYKDLTVYVEVTVESNVSGKLEASDSKLKMDKGDEETIKLKYDDESISGSKATWTTSKSSVATVDDGVVKAKGKGTATITAKYKNEKVEIEVTVGGGSTSDLLEADDTDITLKKGDKETIKLSYDGKSVSASNATWTTSKSSVATVSKGVITAKANGTATITAKYKGEKVEIEVTVKSSDSLEADDTSISVKKGKKETITLYYDDKELKGSKATWSTSDSSVATVKDGVVTGKKKGTATITAKYKDESVKIKVTVK
ncbi:Ig-like domain-containing protein [Brevibacillus choshinensis]|uniref:Ig-like domain-containing protein n=1 Tax=Brevibacillus choshinensis TaxID=54911 RepID=A0ABX7FH44_BRECH|nr:Ig-like domain-containing protein [Brevibacillus choshinensis]QRG65524.1 Ig-like domain-containing protein [Brevibacillus choshinensis]